MSSQSFGCLIRLQKITHNLKKMKRYCKRLLYQYHFLAQLILLLLLSISTTVLVNGQSIQGYIYWDTNANGILDGLSSSNIISNSDNEKSELENGIIDVTVQVHSCYPTTNDDNDGKFLVLLYNLLSHNKLS